MARKMFVAGSSISAGAYEAANKAYVTISGGGGASATWRVVARHQQLWRRKTKHQAVQAAVSGASAHQIVSGGNSMSKSAAWRGVRR